MKKPVFTGAAVAIITPFKSTGEVDYEEFGKITVTYFTHVKQVQLTVIVPDVGGNRRQNNVVKHTNLILFHANGRKVTPPRLRQNNQAVAGINCTDNACFVGSRIIKLNEIGGVLMQNHFLSVSLYKPYEHAATVKTTRWPHHVYAQS